MKKLLLVSMITIFTLSILAACGQSDKSSGEDSKDEKKVLKMATSADFPPFETIDAASGDYIGFDIELTKYIADELGYKLEISNLDFEGLVSALQSKRADLVASGMNATKERKENVDFSIEYHQAGSIFVTLKDSKLKSIEDLDGKKIGVQLGSIQDEGAKKLKKSELKEIEIAALNKVPDLIQELKTGRIDAVYLDESVAVGYIEEADLAGFNDPTASAPGYAIAFPKGSNLVEKFDKVLKEMQENGELEKLEKKWLEAK
ncbi:transporter substrate-binding domain-containing protein [Ferdinandcohnia quinoae]|uniref:Transporter substrate-binding domain-containing protein n=1 Tax=Fredinandcohnia quinoae TaxID=2918902 RepID=A0AAW5E9G4_9BACI|nr:transporter substrate-binding domain-containing protein [Fredinandcohnia sp. SECRCQ15]MCH1626652.1 transporter substrate-binding domain-containing protein [Fredinandcohnia sp. SECRCQ15]